MDGRSKQSVTAENPAGQVPETILEALPGDRVLQSNALATVTTNCLIVRGSDDHSRIVIPIVHVSGIKTEQTTYPGLLVVSAACFLICAAALSSKQQENGSAVPSGILGAFFLIAYLGYRRVAVLFITQSDRTLTGEGSSGQARTLIKAVRSVQAAKAARQATESSA